MELFNPLEVALVSNCMIRFRTNLIQFSTHVNIGKISRVVNDTYFLYDDVLCTRLSTKCSVLMLNTDLSNLMYKPRRQGINLKRTTCFCKERHTKTKMKNQESVQACKNELIQYSFSKRQTSF